MNKTIVTISFILFFFALMLPGSAQAQPVELDDVSFIIDFEEAEFGASPVLSNGRMLLPMREFFEVIGADIDWCDEQRMVTASHNETQIALTIEKHTAYINDNMLLLDVAPSLINGSTYVPVRFAAESLGYEIIWSDVYRTVYAFSDTEDLDLSFLTETTMADGFIPPGTEIIDVFSGTASWYGGKFHGRRTTSGEVFDKYELTAAHRTLPFGTFVRVTHVATDKAVIVKINDRGPHIRGRVIDLSMAAAEIIGLRARGLGEVVVEVLDNYY